MPRFAERWIENWENSIEKGGHLPTAYLFVGPEGSGRRETAARIAQKLLGRIQNHPDLIRIGPDKKNPKSDKRSIRIETIRDLIHRLSFKPFEGNRLVVILEEVELMTEEAANALLKTLEEPPDYLLFLLICSSVERLPPTIRSRCQRVSFQIEEGHIRGRLQESFSSWCEEITPLFDANQPPFSKVSKAAESIAHRSENLPSFFEILRGLWHDLVVYRETGEESSLLLPGAIEMIRRESRKRDPERLFNEIDFMGETERALEGNVNKMLALERLFVKLTS